MVYNSIIEALAKMGGIKDWAWVHLKVGLPGDKKHEIYFSNPDYAIPVEKQEEVQPQPIQPVQPPPPPETLEEKINRFRTAPVGGLSVDEETWFKERQKELEHRKIGQIVAEDSMNVALAKLKKIGVDK